jgi:predicted acylesterase/phospholipase RssA
MTSALPILISPVCIEDKCYIDGGVSSNYPLNYCIESGKNPDEILGFKNKYSDSKNTITSESTILDFLMGFLYKAVFSVCTYNNQPPIKYEVIFDREYVSFEILRNTLSNIEVRKDLLKNGIESAKEFLSKLKEDILEDSIQELTESSL